MVALAHACKRMAWTPFGGGVAVFGGRVVLCESLQAEWGGSRGGVATAAAAAADIAFLLLLLLLLRLTGAKMRRPGGR